MRNVGAVVILCAVTWIYLTMANEDDSTQDLEPGLNRYCKKRDDCPKFGYWCDGNMTCQCSGMYIPNQAKTNCIGGIGQKCSYDIDCIPKAFCHMQTKCKCKDKYHPTDDGLACVKNSSGTSSLKYSHYLNSLAVIISLIYMKIS